MARIKYNKVSSWHPALNEFTQGSDIYDRTQAMFQPCKILATGISATLTSLFATTLQAGDNWAHHPGTSPGNTATEVLAYTYLQTLYIQNELT